MTFLVSHPEQKTISPIITNIHCEQIVRIHSRHTPKIKFALAASSLYQAGKVNISFIVYLHGSKMNISYNQFLCYNHSPELHPQFLNAPFPLQY